MAILDKNRVFPNIKHKEVVDLNIAVKLGDFSNTKSILSKMPEEIINEVKESGLRGRGGAGFPTGMKWSFVPKPEISKKPHYLVINADESEPGTCKDREIIKHEAYKIIEGAIYAAFAIGAKVCYMYIRGEYYAEYLRMQDAVDECYAAKMLGKNIFNSGFDFDFHLHRGAGAYICGEESALLESLEGKRGMPRLKPPFPAISGLYQCPTVINNVETIASVPAILNRGADWYKGIGRDKNHGTKLYCISGHVNNPCVIEEEMSVPLKYLIEKYAGGVTGGWDNLQAIIPGGSSTPLITKDLAEKAIMDYDGMKEVGSSLGTAGIVVINKSVSIAKVIENISYFYKHESCGQCSPCREGTDWIYKLIKRIANKDAKKSEVDKLFNLTKQMEGHTICALADAAAWPVQGLIKHFRKELEDGLMEG